VQTRKRSPRRYSYAWFGELVVPQLAQQVSGTAVVTAYNPVMAASVNGEPLSAGSRNMRLAPARVTVNAEEIRRIDREVAQDEPRRR
jgi:hypothetical protein